MGDIRVIHAEVRKALHPDIPIRIVRGAVLPPYRDALGHTAPRRTAPPLVLDEPNERTTHRTTRSAHDETALTLLCLALLCLAASVLLVWLLLSFGS